ncbi:uncharacterized protein JCM6883_005043 [Sporobolomyces salmoneus]|uniref:uncharacterized protein n=1 Tax=Sporobolomyces salmoneus TaxID=183962 RepID=UPI00316B611F
MADFLEDPLFSTHGSSLWTAYSYPADQFEEDPLFALPSTETRVINRRDSLVVFGVAAEGGGGSQQGGLGFDSYLDPALLVQPNHQQFLHPPSPGLLPGLSSADSTPSSSSALHTPYGPFDASPPVGQGGLLLPSAPISETTTNSNSRFAKLQESYLDQHDEQHHLEEQQLDYLGADEQQPPYSIAAPPSTPSRRNNPPPPSSSQLWRSPSSHSVNSSPSKSPYPQRPKPYDRPAFDSPTKDFHSPTKTVVRRNLPIALQDDVNLSPTKPGGGRRPRANLSIEVPSKYGLRSRLPVIAASPQVPSTDGSFPVITPEMDVPDVELTESTLQQVENLLQEFGPLARSGNFDSSASSSSGVSSYAPSRNPSFSSASYDPRYNVSGVALSLEDMAQLDDPILTAAFDSVTMQQYPASAPPHQTSFNLPEPPSPAGYHLTVPNSLRTTPLPTPSPSYVHDSYSSQQPVFENWTPSSYVASRSNAPFGSHSRSISAPRTAYYPTEDDFASLPFQPPISQSLAHTYSTHSLPTYSPPHAAAGRANPTLRRRSSVASGSPSTQSPWSQPPPRPEQPFHSYSYGPPPASPTSSEQPLSPYHDIPLPLRPAPPLGSTVDVTPPPSPTKARKPRGAASGSATSSPTKTSPRKKRAAAKTKNPSAMFVNFSAADAKKLLSGVAPSGSSRKKREEEEAAAAAEEAELEQTSEPVPTL